MTHDKTTGLDPNILGAGSYAEALKALNKWANDPNRHTCQKGFVTSAELGLHAQLKVIRALLEAQTSAGEEIDTRPELGLLEAYHAVSGLEVSDREKWLLALKKIGNSIEAVKAASQQTRGEVPRQQPKTYKCGHCGYEGECFGTPVLDGDNSSVSDPWCKQCGMNNKLTPTPPVSGEVKGE